MPVRTTKWRNVVWHALHSWEKSKWSARRNGFRLSVSLRRDGRLVVIVAECKPPVHCVVEVARKEFPAGSDITDDATQWAEAKADELAQAVAT